MIAKRWMGSGIVTVTCFVVDILLLGVYHEHSSILTYVTFAFFVLTLFLWAKFSRNNRRPLRPDETLTATSAEPEETASEPVPED